MITWDQFIYFAIAAVLLWAVGAWAAWKGNTKLAYGTTGVGLVVFFSFIVLMWISLEHLQEYLCIHDGSISGYLPSLPYWLWCLSVSICLSPRYTPRR